MLHPMEGVSVNLGDLVAELTVDAITPSPCEPLGMTIVGVNRTQGDCQFSTNGGASWGTITVASETNAVLLAPGANDRIRFVPPAGFQGVVDTGLTYRAWDPSDGQLSGTSGVDTTDGFGTL